MDEYPWYLLALIPVISGAIGYVTNVLAVKMMFHPTEFVGIKPFLGWQGIVPGNALALANRGLNLITAKILKISEVVEDADPDDFIRPIEGQLEERTRDTIQRQAQEHFAPMWGALDDKAKGQVFAAALVEVKSMSRRVVEAIMKNMEAILNLQNVIVRVVGRKPEILSRMFLEVGSAEFKFIERSGWWFGLMFGMVQLGVWVVFPEWWVLPLFGFLVGYATNWVALKLVFEPKEPRKLFGFTFHGLFHQRQKAVAEGFARVSTEDMFSDENLFEELRSPEARQRIRAIIEAEADALVQRYQSHPMAAMLMTPERMQQIREETLSVTEEEMFKEGGVIEGLTAQSQKIRTMLHTRMLDLDAESFESVLRPAFQQDEWKLILAGAVLGGVAGLLQLIYLFGQSLSG